MHHQAGIALVLGRELEVVVDAVAVEGERRIAEQQHRVGRHPAVPGRVLGRRFARARGLARLRLVAKHQVLLLLDAGAVRGRHLVADGNEDEAPAAALP